MPLGPYILWAERLTRSAFHPSTLVGIRPTACTASLWKGTPRSRQSAPISATGWIVPTSLLAAMTETRTVSGRIAAATSAAATIPDGPTPTRVTSKPSRSSDRHGSSTAACSIAVVTMWRPFPACDRAIPFTARLSDSVAPEVKTISSGAAPMRAATCSRARSTARCASWPNAWLRPDGLPYFSPKNGSMAATTAGSAGVVA